jgi:hypothetical protein
MVNVTAVPFVENTPRKSVYYANPAFRLAQKKEPGIGGHHTTVEVNGHFFSAHTWKLKLQLVIFYQAASLVLVNLSKNYYYE